MTAKTPTLLTLAAAALAGVAPHAPNSVQADPAVTATAGVITAPAGVMTAPAVVIRAPAMAIRAPAMAIRAPAAVVTAPAAVVTPRARAAAASATAAARCPAPGPGYYAFELVTTRNVPGTGLAKGTVEVSFSPASPFAVSLAADGSYAYDLSVVLDRTRTPAHGTLVAWVTTPDLASVERLGPLDEDQRVSGRVAWNKFLVVITLESSDDQYAERWRGPVAFRGMSRSGMMHTMVGHGAFQQENCAAYGY